MLPYVHARRPLLLSARVISLLLCLLVRTVVAFPGVDGTFTVTEEWSVTLEYTDFADTFTGTKHFEGTQSGTVHVSNGQFQIIDRTGIAWSAPGQNQSLKSRSVSMNGGNYSIRGGYVFAPGFGTKAYGLVFGGCFAVKVPLVDGEVPAFERFQTYSGSGPADAIEGGGNMIGGSLKAYVSSTVTFREVVGAPAISEQPQAQTAYEGQNVTFNVTAGGKAPLSYFWRKGTTVLSGTHGSVLTITNVQLADAGGYSVIVSNVGGTVTSATAQLLVKPPGPPWYEGWETAALGAHTASSNAVSMISGDKGRWVIEDTVSFFPECGPPLNHADIVLENGRKLLKLTSVHNDGGCAENIGVSIDRRTATSFPIPLVQDMQISFFERGFMANPLWNGFFNCVAPPCGDTVNLTVLDNAGNQVVYIFQRAPNYVEHTGIGYIEIFLDPAGGSFTRNVFADFARIAGASSVGTSIEGVSFGIAAEGWATLDDLLIGSTSTNADRTIPTLTITSPSAGTRLTNDTVTFQGTAGDNAGVALVEYRIENAAGVTAYQPAIGTLQWSAVFPNLSPGTNVVRVRAKDVAGNFSTVAARSVVFVVVSPLTVRITGVGTVTPALDGQLLEVGRNFTLAAKPGPGFVFSNWTGVLPPSASPTLTFVMRSNLTLSANFVANPFPLVAGSFAGLFSEEDNVRQNSSGFFTFVATASGVYSGSLLLNGAKLPVSGQLNLEGNATNLIGLRGGEPMSVVWAVNLQRGNQVTGIVSSASWHAKLVGDRAVFNARSQPAPWIGKYTFVIPGTNQPALPEGDGFGTATMDAGGKVTFNGTLADGTKVSASAPVSQAGYFPLYAAPYQKRGSILSWVIFDTNRPSDDLHGLMSWIRPPGSSPNSYTNGFEVDSVLTGSLYLAPVGASNRVVNIVDGVVTLSGAGLVEPSANAVVFGPNNKVTNAGPNKLALTPTASSGLFKGTFTQTGTTERVNFSGAVLQKSRQGAGFFLRANQSGRVEIKSE